MSLSTNQKILATLALTATSIPLASYAFSSRRDQRLPTDSCVKSTSLVLPTDDLSGFNLVDIDGQERLLIAPSAPESEARVVINVDPTPPTYTISDERYENGNPKAQGMLKDGQPDGPWRYYREDGSLQQIGIYSEGVISGPWQFFNENSLLTLEYQELDGVFASKTFDPQTGQLRKEESRTIRKDSNGDEHDERVGLFTEYFPNGQPRCQGNYTQGKEDGLWYGWHPDGKLRFQGIFLAGVRSGNWQYWNEDGSHDTEFSGNYIDDVKQQP